MNAQEIVIMPIKAPSINPSPVAAGEVVKAVAQRFACCARTMLNDRYADSIIAGRVEAFDGLEIQGVRNLNVPADPSGTQCEVDNKRPQFFSVYVHVTFEAGGGVECVGDFGTHALAEEYAIKLAKKYHWPIRDCYAHADLEMAQVLGFETVDQMREHQVWLEKNGTAEYKKWVAEIVKNRANEGASQP